MASLSKARRLTRSVQNKQNEVDLTNNANTKTKKAEKQQTQKNKATKRKQSVESSLVKSKDTPKTVQKYCVEKCKFNNKYEGKDSVRCGLCGIWFHVVCMKLTVDEIMGFWACHSCRCMPRQINEMCTILQRMQDQLTQVAYQNSELTKELIRSTRECDELRVESENLKRRLLTKKHEFERQEVNKQKSKQKKQSHNPRNFQTQSIVAQQGPYVVPCNIKPTSTVKTTVKEVDAPSNYTPRLRYLDQSAPANRRDQPRCFNREYRI